jgi:hypothetical protein
MNDMRNGAGDDQPEEQQRSGPRVLVPTSSTAQTPTSARWWTRLLDGDQVWGSIEVSPPRYGVSHYRLVVFPPGLDRVERRLLRGWRVWPTWGFGLWLFSLCLCSILTSAATFVTPTIVWLGAGIFLFARVGALRTQVRTLCVSRIAGYPDQQAAATYAEMEALVIMLRSADKLCEQGRLSITGHEAVWWQVYDRLGTKHPRTVDNDPSI